MIGSVFLTLDAGVTRMGTTTRFNHGVTNVAKTSNTGLMGQPDPTKFHTYMEDFDRYAAAEWTITTTEAGAGSATEALANVDGGVLLVTNDDADDDADFLQKVGESFLFATNKKLFFKARFKVSDATQSDVVIGLQITDTTPLAVSDGVYFLKADGAATVDCLVMKDSTATTESSVATLVDDTFIVLGFAYNGSDEVEVFADDVKVATMVTDNLPDDEELTISFGIQNGEAAAKTMSVDYIMAVKER
jgi:hypothetical protein